MHYFVGGAANNQDDRPDHLDGIYQSTRYFWTNHLDKTAGAFTYCDVRKDSMTVSFIHSDKTVLYNTEILPRSHPANKVSEGEIVIKKAPKPTEKKKYPVQHKKQAARLPLFQNFRPKSEQELERDDLKRQQQLRLFQQQQRLQQQRLLEQQNLRAQRYANKMMHRYRGP